jgi:hypothetical protein
MPEPIPNSSFVTQSAIAHPIAAMEKIPAKSPCPECRADCSDWRPFVVHMVADHFWERELADTYWNLAALSRRAASV